jgi:hypothetical protein
MHKTHTFQTHISSFILSVASASRDLLYEIVQKMIDHQPLLGMQKLKQRKKGERRNDDSFSGYNSVYQDIRRHKSGANLKFYNDSFRKREFLSLSQGFTYIAARTSR